jgi:alpha-mannosidase
MTSKVLGGPAADAIEVINTCAWERSGLITVAGKAPAHEIMIQDESGKNLPTQMLSDGNIAFMAKNIPALGSKIYKIIINQNIGTSEHQNTGTMEQWNTGTMEHSKKIETASFKLSIDPATGAISSLIWKKTGKELVDHAAFSGLNEYLYVEGRMPDQPLKAKLLNVSMVESGPILYTIKIESEAPGCRSFITTIRIIDEQGIVEVINTLDREKVYTPEAVHFAFPLSLPGGTMRYDLAYGYCRPEQDQVPGSNKNYLAMEHWLDVSDEKSGITVICPDAPLFEAGKLTMDEILYGWVDSIPPAQTFISYVMNNYWETNYAASQEGKCTFRYIIMPHDGFDPAKAEKEAISQRQPLLSRKGGGWQKARQSMLELQNENLIITSLKPLEKGTKILAAVYNTGNNDEIPKWPASVNEVVLSDPDGLTGHQLTVNYVIPPGGVRYFKIALKN